MGLGDLVGKGQERTYRVMEMFLIAHIVDSIVSLGITKFQIRASCLSKGNPEPLSSHPWKCHKCRVVERGARK